MEEFTVNFDFGFTTETEDDIVKSSSTNKKAQQLFDAIKPLLDNLRKNPEKEMIRWPDRKKKVDEFEKRLKAILNS